jgi:bacterial/archaeal transporter family-2 protein
VTDAQNLSAAGRASLIALALGFGAGAGLAIQAFVNGRLARSLGSAPLAAVVNQGVGLAGLLTLAVATGALVRARRRLRVTGWPRWWHFVAFMNGALFVTVTSAAAPKVGIALLTVALVAGQTGGSLVVDRFGLSPAGRRLVTAPRLFGAALALVAIALGGVGRHGDPHAGLLALALVAGAGMAVVQAALGHVARLAGEPLVAAGLSFAIGGVVILVIAFVVTAGVPPNGWSAAPPELWIGGLIGASTGVVMAFAVQRLGVLRLTLAIVAGQSAAGIVIDLIAPAHHESVTMLMVVSVLLTFVSVVVSSRTRRPVARLRRPVRP